LTILIKQGTSLGKFFSSDFTVFVKNGPLHYCVEILKEIMNCSTIQLINVNRGHAATIIATNVQNGVPCFTDTSLEISFPFISRLIDNSLLYARPDCTQTLLQLVFQKFQKSLFKVVFVYPFVANSSMDMLASNLQTQ